MPAEALKDMPAANIAGMAVSYEAGRGKGPWLYVKIPFYPGNPRRETQAVIAVLDGKVAYRANRWWEGKQHEWKQVWEAGKAPAADK